MGGSPCKAWDWRNPIVQTLFTQGATRTARFAHKRAGLSFGLSPRQRGCAPRARAFPALDGDIPKAGFRSRGAGRGRRIMPRPGRSASVPRGGGGRAEPARRGPLAPAMFGPSGRTPPPPEGGGKTAQAGQKRQRPAGGRQQNRQGRAKAPTSPGGGGGRAEPARRGPLAPAMFGPSGRTPPPPPGALAYRALSLAPSLVSSTP